MISSQRLGLLDDDGGWNGQVRVVSYLVTWLLITQGSHPSSEALSEIGVMDGILFALKQNKVESHCILFLIRRKISKIEKKHYFKIEIEIKMKKSSIYQASAL